VIGRAVALFKSRIGELPKTTPISSILSIECRDEKQFLKGFSDDIDSAEMFIKLHDGSSFNVKYRAGHTEVAIRHADQAIINKITALFD